jgi:hypothetical protein
MLKSLCYIECGAQCKNVCRHASNAASLSSLYLLCDSCRTLDVISCLQEISMEICQIMIQKEVISGGLEGMGPCLPALGVWGP